MKFKFNVKIIMNDNKIGKVEDETDNAVALTYFLQKITSSFILDADTLKLNIEVEKVK
jgi:hypothetical protein